MKSPRNDRPWQNRRRGFDDDGFFGNTPAPPSFPSFASPEAQGTVKWFNAEKGYGFVAMSDGSGDVFLHANALQAAGYQTVGPGATVRVRVGQGQKGRQIEQVVSVDESTAEPSAPRRSGGGGGGGGMGRGRGGFGGGGSDARRPDMSTAVEMSGTVKWYNPDKGFGFITPQGGGKDVFIHARVLERAGIAPLREGQTVRMSVVQGMKGPEAGAISED